MVIPYSNSDFNFAAAMEEELLQHVWKAGLFDQSELKTSEGHPVEIIKRGTLNSASGPDFINAHIRINGVEWYGQIEIHVHADEWFKHKHHKDPAYNSTILHVVLKDNKVAKRLDGSSIPGLSLENRIPPKISDIYEHLKFCPDEIACSSFIQNVRQTEIRQAIDRALVSRLENRSQWISEWLRVSTGDWHSVFMASLIRSFGFGINSEAFEMLARHIPVSMLCRNAHDQFTVEAMVFGCAGFLNESARDEYHGKLKQEWEYLSYKYGLHAMDSGAFKHMRMRPGGFPEIRLAQLSSAITEFQKLLDLSLNHPEISEIISILRKSPDLYWLRHYQFAKVGKRLNGPLSVSAAQIVIINAIIPFLFYYGSYIGNESFRVKALDMLQCLPGEQNHIIHSWKLLGVQGFSAYDTQGLIELRKNHCDKRQCIHCPIGASVVQSFRTEQN